VGIARVSPVIARARLSRRRVTVAGSDPEAKELTDMNPSRAGRAPLAGICAALVALTLPASGAAKVDAASASGEGPTAITRDGAVRGMDVPGGYAFRGLPYATPPIGDLRWRAPQPPASWGGIRDATQYAASCPQKPSLFEPPGPRSEDCLYLNVSTPTLRRGAKRPVLVWIHGGGFTQDGALNYEATKLATDGTVVVTVDYRLGALGFLAHQALASRPGGPSGNYGLMDQQAALRWVRHDIARFGGDPHDVAIAGQSAGGASVLAHMVSPRSRGLFDRTIVQSGAFALNQVPLSQA
jgi:para-nitrobenzyl esterase